MDDPERKASDSMQNQAFWQQRVYEKVRGELHVIDGEGKSCNLEFNTDFKGLFKRSNSRILLTHTHGDVIDHRKPISILSSVFDIFVTLDFSVNQLFF